MYYTHLYGEIRKSIILLYMVFGCTLECQRHSLNVRSNVVPTSLTLEQHWNVGHCWLMSAETNLCVASHRRLWLQLFALRSLGSLSCGMGSPPGPLPFLRGPLAPQSTNYTPVTSKSRVLFSLIHSPCTTNTNTSLYITRQQNKYIKGTQSGQIHRKASFFILAP